MVGGGKGEASHDVIDVQFFSVGCEDQVVAVLTYVNGFGDELILCDGGHIEVPTYLPGQIACRTGGRRGRRWRVAGCVCRIRRFCRGR